jgi:hypothetical protein
MPMIDAPPQKAPDAPPPETPDAAPPPPAASHQKVETPLSLKRSCFTLEDHQADLRRRHQKPLSRSEAEGIYPSAEVDAYFSPPPAPPLTATTTYRHVDGRTEILFKGQLVIDLPWLALDDEVDAAVIGFNAGLGFRRS